MRGLRAGPWPRPVLLGTLVLSLMVLPRTVAAQEKPADEQLELESLLRQETELATKTRLNHDFVPGMVTVLQGSELEALGFRNVWEALSLVPGVQTVRDLYGSPLILVRGINFIFNSGNIKILVDSVPLNQEGAGMNSSILAMPVEEVERIEFMRGPGSAIYGDFAYLGLLNIITRREGRRAFVSFDGRSTMGGIHLSSSRSSGGTPGRDGWSLGLSGLSDRDIDGKGSAGGKETKRFGRFSWNRGGLSLSLLHLEADHDSLIAVGSGRYSENRTAAEVRYGRALTPSVSAEARASILANNDNVGAKFYDGQTMEGGVDLRWTASRGHRLLLTTGYVRSEVSRGHLVLAPLFNFTFAGDSRHWTSLALQDQWDCTKRLTLTGGIRIDDYSDIGRKTTPRLAAVWSVDDHQIIKAQYAEGFRSPAFFELVGAGNAGLDAETIATTELSYILRRTSFSGRVTLFHSDLDKMIQPYFVPGGVFSNLASAKTRGVETEWAQQLASNANLTANVSWVDPEDRRFTRDVQAASGWLGNLSLVVKPTSRTVLSGRWNHVGDRGGFVGTPTIGGYDTLDLTATVSELLPGLSIRGGVKNLADDDVVYITTLPPPLDPIQAQYGGRTFWADVSYHF